MATLTHLSQNSGSLADGQSFVLMPESRVLEDPLSPGYSQPLHVSEPQKSLGHRWGQPWVGCRWAWGPSRGEPAPGFVFSFQCLTQASWPSTGLPAQDLRRGGSARKSKGKCGPCSQQLPGQDTERTICSLIPENPNGELLSSVYNEPYSAHSSQHHPAAPPPHLDLSNVRELGGGGTVLPPGEG